MPRCVVCLGNWPKLHGHHVVPREFGGENGPIVDLCGQCHMLVHTSAKARLRGSSEEFFSPDNQMRAEPLIQTILNAEQVYNASQGVSAPKKVMVDLDEPSLLVKLHKLKKDMGYSSMNKFLNAIFSRITRHL